MAYRVHEWLPGYEAHGGHAEVAAVVGTVVGHVRLAIQTTLSRHNRHTEVSIRSQGHQSHVTVHVPVSSIMYKIGRAHV